jgi:ATP-dependent DNA helicase RecQ
MTLTTAHSVLKDTFGYDSFRGEQENIISHVISGGNALVLMPTGAGKSLCFQIPSIVRAGVGIVISPLIALMQDQVTGLEQLGVKASFLNSSQSEQEAKKVWRELYENKVDILYISPERFLSDGFIDILLSKIPVALFAIDEAHCVSQWGHDFRPEYQKLTIIEEKFPNVPRIALTATADAPTRKEIVTQLKLSEAPLFTTSFDRPNIRYLVTVKNDPKKQLIGFLNEYHQGDSGIVYCLTRKKVEEIAEFLSSKGFKALPYHAGLSNQLREENQKQFIHEEGTIVVATVAFGMGIDKSNVRFVAHLDLPKSMEGYYQETGRAGRDGLPSTAWMTFGGGDFGMVISMISNSDAPEERKRVETQKLRSLFTFAETHECRRSVLLRYFGEEYSGHCGNCDNCISPKETWDGTIPAQKALACIYRTGERFGASHLADVLTGATTEKINKFNHNNLSTFGIGKDLEAKTWISIFRQLTAQGYILPDMEAYGALKLTESSKGVLRGETKVLLNKESITRDSKRGSSKRLAAARPADDSPEGVLFRKLKEKRLQLAKSQNVPPYVIFHDKTLFEIAQVRPQNEGQLRQITGLGEAKMARYGQTILETVWENAGGSGEL